MAEKVSRRTQAKPLSVRELIERNQWDPFKRVDPKILETMHKQTKGERASHLHDLEEAPF